MGKSINLGDVIQAGSDFAGGLITSAIQANQSRLAYERNIDLMNRAAAINEQSAQAAYERELEADSTKYQRQVQDLKAAGLNPMLAAGQAGGSVSSSAASVSNPSSSPAHMPGINLGDIAAIRQLKMQQEVTDSEVALNKAKADNLRADTVGKELYNVFFSDTTNLRKILLGDEHERNVWERELGFRGVEVKEKAQSLAEENAKHYNSYLDAQKDLIGAQKVTESFKQAMYAANAREASMNATYKAAMLEVDKQYTEARTESERNEAQLLGIEAKLKNGVYTEDYINAMRAQGIAEADISKTIAEYKKGDYHSASKSLQKMFKALEKEGCKGNWSVTSPYFGSSGNGAASASALPGSR